MVLISREKMVVDAASVGAGFHFLMPLCAWTVYGKPLPGFNGSASRSLPLASSL
jgi:hypothetical protein